MIFNKLETFISVRKKISSWKSMHSGSEKKWTNNWPMEVLWIMLWDCIICVASSEHVTCLRTCKKKKFCLLDWN